MWVPSIPIEEGARSYVAPPIKETQVMSSAINVVLPDGSERELPTGATGSDLAVSLGKRAGKDAVVAIVDDVQVDLSDLRLCADSGART